jgi:hypothetical protein
MAKKNDADLEVGVEELKQAVLQLIVERYGGRVLTWETATQALALAAFHVKQAALFAPEPAPARNGPASAPAGAPDRSPASRQATARPRPPRPLATTSVGPVDA